jgi:predicted phosphodiesterase
MSDVDGLIDDVIADPDKLTSCEWQEIEACVDRVIPVLKKEKALVELNGRFSFVGDTHGDFETTKSIIKRFFDVDHLVFLGDYIDRELDRWGSVYNLTYLLFLKYRFPEKILLLKGNHECNYVIPCFPYEFEWEVSQRYGSSNAHGKYVEVFSTMPLMVFTGDVFAAHGGILKGADLEKLRNVGKNDLQVVESIVWSDPLISPVYRGAGDPFDERDLVDFLDEIKAKVFIRGHDYNTLGFSIYGDRCLTIFSSRRYKEMGNQGVLVACAEGDVSCAGDLKVYDVSSGRWKKYDVALK